MLKGINLALSKLRGRDLKPVDDELDGELQQMVEQEEFARTISREDNIRFADITGDINPIHRDVDAARAFNFAKITFRDTPIIGTYLMMLGEQVSYSLLERLKKLWGEDGEDLKITGVSSKFKDPVYPEDNVRWELAGYRESSENVDLSLIGKVGKNEVIELTTRLGYLFERMPPIASPIIQRSEDKLTTITLEDIPEINGLTNGQSSDRFPMTLAPSIVPKAMLAYLKEKTGDMIGLNRLMDFKFFGEPQVGEIQVDMYRPKRISRTTRSDFHRYPLRAVCGLPAESKPLCYGEIKIMSPHEIDFTPTI